MGDQWLKDFENAKKSSTLLLGEVSNEEFVNRRLDAKRAALLRGRLAQLKSDVTQLQQSLMAISQNIQAHGVTKKELTRRGDLIAQLSETSEEIQEYVRSGVRRPAQSKGDASLRRQRMPKEDLKSMSQADILAFSERENDVHEETLDFLSGTVSNLKSIGGDISSEIDLHCRLLGDLEDQTDDANGKLKKQQSQLRKLGEQSNNCSLWAFIGITACTLVVLVFYF